MPFPPGSIVRRRLDGFAGILFWHWGVYLGNDQVIHFNGEKKKDQSAIIRRDTQHVFAAGRKIHLHSRPKNEAHARAICAFAENLYGLAESNGFNGQYDFTFHNCQDFCKKCYEVCY